MAGESGYRIAGVCFVMAVLLVACTRAPPETALRASALALERAIVARDTGAVMDLLGGSFVANDTLDRAQAQRLLTGYFLRFRDIRLMVSGLQVEVNSYDPARASMHASVAVAGMQGFVPEQGALYRVDAEWRLEGGDWLLYRVHWQ